jgi:hypothetical protein
VEIYFKAIYLLENAQYKFHVHGFLQVMFHDKKNTICIFLEYTPGKMGNKSTNLAILFYSCNKDSQYIRQTGTMFIIYRGSPFPLRLMAYAIINLHPHTSSMHKPRNPLAPWHRGHLK